MELVSAAATPYLYADVAGEDAGVLADPTPYTPSVAVMLGSATPAPGDFHTADWVTNTVNPAVPIYSARLLVGAGSPSGIVLTAGKVYTVHVKFEPSPEVVQLRAGQIRAY